MFSWDNFRLETSNFSLGCVGRATGMKWVTLLFLWTKIQPTRPLTLQSSVLASHVPSKKPLPRFRHRGDQTSGLWGVFHLKKYIWNIYKTEFIKTNAYFNFGITDITYISFPA